MVKCTGKLHTYIPGVSGVEELQLLKNEGRAYFPQNVDNQ